MLLLKRWGLDGFVRDWGVLWPEEEEGREGKNRRWRRADAGH